MIFIVKILWVLYTIVVKLATIGVTFHILEKMFDALERMVDRHQGIVTI